MWTKSMIRSLHKLSGWLRRFYTSNGPRESHPRRQSPSNHKKLESRTSSDTETECVQHHTIVKASTMAPHILDSDSPTRTRIGIPESEEYDKMIAELPFRVISCPLLQAKKLEARRFCARYNVDDEILKDDTMPLHELFMGLRKERERLLRTVIGAIGQGPVIEPPFNFQYGCNITIGDSFYANVNLRIMDSGLVTIGNKVLIGPNVTIVTELHEKEIMSRRSGKVFAKPVTIEDDCWIGVGTTILPGVTIGRGSVIGAGSIVTRDIPSASVAWGNPARVVELVGDANAVFAGMN
ncbi:hypothetical protein TCE0_042f14872 [Talaromyces pinophilus]|uniref:Maltose/galactoside acetyltransferase domain-containing protein n=1 Tax=Talaromyces pinophilus TaxID=128442 RepID=A0A6V8HIG2_TALPI|nr:hypothetical protein DPV78_009822 [Talaromyces pinophilus]PCH03941.1 hypothetical protein PENOC_036020 [Penicillium occitanis (nom. inval.)]PCH09370.1 Maltose/galactoside acetyltransferase [Penicillium occitanis (nom. inval.)]GAM41619.1 hypothetical protein TCE0_042f14872 [Talaromyces pinophilus]